MASYCGSDLAQRIAALRGARPERPFAFEHDGVLLNGRLDVLHRDGPRALVLDYKTNTLAEGTPEEIVEADYRLQRLVYALACFGAGAEEVEVVYHFLERPDAVVTTHLRAADVPELEAELSEAIARIRAGEFRPTPSEFNCAGCPALDVVCAGPRLRTRAARARGGRAVRVAVICDVHGNLPALEAVLAEVASLEVDRIVCGGDVVAGPFPRECLDRLLALDAVFVRGNADRLPETVPGSGWVAERLGPLSLDFLRALPESVSLDGVLYCHGSPRSDEEILTLVSPDERFRAALEGVSERLVVGGHTHVQFIREVDGIRFANAGSVGMPYEGRTGAFWGLVDGEEIELRHTPYAVEAAMATIRASGYPDDHDLVATLVEPKDPDEVSAYFESIAT